MAVLWHVVMPMLTRAFGYFPARVLGLGEDIPADIALQWAARRDPDLNPEATTSDATRARSMIARYQSVGGPAFVLGFMDDAFATPAGTKRFLSAFPRLRCESLFVAPHQFGMTRIGHFGFFRRGAEERLWPLVLPFLQYGGKHAVRDVDVAA